MAYLELFWYTHPAVGNSQKWNLDCKFPHLIPKKGKSQYCKLFFFKVNVSRVPWLPEISGIVCGNPQDGFWEFCKRKWLGSKGFLKIEIPQDKREFALPMIGYSHFIPSWFQRCHRILRDLNKSSINVKNTQLLSIFYKFWTVLKRKSTEFWFGTHRHLPHARTVQGGGFPVPKWAIFVKITGHFGVQGVTFV